jgi:DNA-binding MarR family transcriptional regulator
MFILGSGLGLVMAIPLVVVQNAVKYEELGAATSNSSFFRLIGACFGTAAFGAVFSNLITGNLRKALPHVPIPAKIKTTLSNPTSVKSLPPEIRHGVIIAISHTVDKVFLLGAPVAVLAVVLAWLLPEVPLRKYVGAPDAGDILSATPPRTSIEEMELAISRLEQKENRIELYEDLAQRAEVTLTPRACWMLFRIGDNHSEEDSDFLLSLENLKVPQDMITDSIKALTDATMVTSQPHRNGSVGNDHHITELTEAGRRALAKLLEARRVRLCEMLAGWDIDANPELEELIKRLATQLMADDRRLLEVARTAVKVSV